MKTLPLIFPNQVCPSPLSSLSPPTPNSTALPVVLFLWLKEWSCHISYAVLLNDIMDLHMSSLGTLRALVLLYLVPEPWCVFYTKRRQPFKLSRGLDILILPCGALDFNEILALQKRMYFVWFLSENASFPVPH